MRASEWARVDSAYVQGAAAPREKAGPVRAGVRRRPARHRRRLPAPALVLGCALVCAAIWLVPVWQVAELRQAAQAGDGLLPNERLQIENEILGTESLARATLGLLLGGGMLLAGLYVAWRRFEASREARVSERFTAAVEQLGSERPDGSPRMETRIGGIYALERIARESDHDYWPVMEVLSAYVRDNAPWNRAEAPAERSSDAAVVPRADVQAVLTILGRRRQPPVLADHPALALNGADLRGANLTGARLDGMSFQGTNLEWANLSQAHLAGANLREASLRGARLSGANLEGARMTRVDLEASHLNGALLRGADLNAGNLKAADLWQADLREANLRDVDLKRADLAQANLDAAILWRANLEGANLEAAHLVGTHLERANLRGALGLTWEQGETVFTDAHTILPEYLRAPDEEPPVQEAVAEVEEAVTLDLSPAAQAAMVELSRRRRTDLERPAGGDADDEQPAPRRKRKPPLAESA